MRDLFRLLDADYQRKRRRSISTMRCSFQHFIAFFGEKAKAIRLGERLDDYEAHRKDEGASVGTLRIELALLHRAYHLAVKKKRLSARSLPDIELPPPDHTAVRKGFFRSGTVEHLCERLPNTIADVVLFLFFCPWRVGAARRLEWRDYDPQDQVLTLRPELNKTGHELRIPVDPEHTPELMAVIERQAERRRADCPFIFHGGQCGTVRLDKHGRQRPCLGDFQKSWDRACASVGMPGRIPHDLRRSGVKHYIEAGVDPHIVMAWSGHRTRSMPTATTSSTSTTCAALANRRATIKGRRRTSSALCSGREPAQLPHTQPRRKPRDDTVVELRGR